MRSLCFIAYAILLTGVTYGQSLPTLITLDVGDTLQTAILTINNVVTKCYLEGPGARTVEFKPVDNSDDKFIKVPDSDVIQCRANVTNIEESDTGLWTLTAEYESGSIQSQSYSLTVNPPQGVTTEAAPQVIDVSYADEQNFNSSVGNRHVLTIGDNVFYKNANCSIIIPSGQQVNLDTLNLPNIEIIESSEICSIAITVRSDEDIGNWTLVSDGHKFSERHQIRLKFSIHVQEIVNASASNVTVVEGNDLYIRLKNAIAAFDTCRLLSPNGNEYDKYEKDDRYVERCGFIVRSIQANGGGNWAIQYGNGIIYRAPILVTVNAAKSQASSNVIWKRDRPVAEVLGAEDAVYCRVIGPDGVVYYDGFGRCRIDIDRALSKHEGVWSMSVGLPGRVLTENSSFKVTVVEADAKPVVSTKVETNKPTVSLTCSVSSPKNISSCKFRHPTGRILMANEGVGENRFSYHGASVGYQSDVHAHDCGLLITDPLEEDLGLWRCAMESEEDVFYGFLKVLCPWAMRDPEVAAAVVTEPTLNATRDVISSIAGDSVSMSCSVQSPISYCYFRARNGTVFNVGPGNSHDQATYLGSGLDAGECGIRFPSLATADSGLWSCHVGFVDQKELEQRSSFTVTVVDPMVSNQRMEGSQLVVEAQVYENRQLDYCRFVRIDGLGFTTENMPDNYINLSQVSQGKCGIAINNPTILERHPWTVVTKIRGQDAELSRVTPIALQATPPVIVYYRMSNVWIIFITLSLSLLLISALFSTKRNRQWTYDRANALRNSFVRKNVQQNAEKNTAMAA